MNQERLSELFMDWADANFPDWPGPTPRTADDGASGDGASTMTTAFRERHQDLLQGVLTGSVQVVDFETVRKRLGPRWRTSRTSVHRITDACIQKRLGPGGRLARIGDDDYVVLFDRLGRSQAQIKAAETADEITRLVCGNKTWGTLSIRAMAPRPVASDGIEAIRTVDDLECAFGAALERLESGDRQEFERIRPGLGIGYWPTLCARKRLVSVYEAALTRRDENGRTLVGAAAYPITDMGVLTYQMDCHALRLAGDQLERFAEHRRYALLMVSVHYGTLATERFRTHYEAISRTLPAQSRTHLILQILRPPPGAPSAYWPDVRDRAPANVFGLVCQVGLEHSAIDGFTEIEAPGLSMDGAEIEPKFEESLRGLNRFLDRARSARIRTLLTGIPSVPLACAAVEAGFAYISGQACVEPVQTPGRVYRVS